MKTIKVFLLSLMVAAVSFGCASKHMQPTTLSPTAGTLGDNESAIVFFRDTSFGGAIQAPIAEARGGDISLVGILSANAKILHKTTPGKHFYVVGGEDSNLLEADLGAGSFYYVRVTPKMGMWKARFQFEPVSKNELASADFKKNIGSCDWYTAKPDAQAWFLDNKASMLDKADNALKKHAAAQSDEKAAVIYPGGGISALIN